MAASLTAEIISVGTELLMGQIVDTNAAYLAARLPRLGIGCYRRQTVGDNKERLTETIITALNRSDIVFTIGGLGPTADDITKETVAEVLGDKMKFDASVARKIESYFERMGVPMAEINLKQALVPERGTALDNPNGTAPGAVFVSDSKKVVVLPGPPREFCPMVENQVIPYLLGYADCWGAIESRTLKITGKGESTVADEIKDLLESEEPTVAPYAKFGEVHLRISSASPTSRDAFAKIDDMEAKIRECLGDCVFGTDDDTLESVTVKALLDSGKTIATAESCTAGMVSAAIADVAGSSGTLLGGVVSYANEVKMNTLGVPKEVLDTVGAVSEECAKAMAEGVRKVTGADIGVSTTGIAGPGGGTDTKPVGLVYIGLATDEGTTVQRNVFNGGRNDVRRRTVQKALDAVRRFLK